MILAAQSPEISSIEQPSSRSAWLGHAGKLSRNENGRAAPVRRTPVGTTRPGNTPEAGKATGTVGNNDSLTTDVHDTTNLHRRGVIVNG